LENYFWLEFSDGFGCSDFLIATRSAWDV